MVFYQLHRISSFIGNHRIRSFHANMFHGLAERDGKEYPNDKTIFANMVDTSPLIISRTGQTVPRVFQPSSHLVVDHNIAMRLREFSGIRLVQVEFKRLVDIPFVAGDFSYHVSWGNVDPCQLLRAQPDVPRFHQEIEKYFEVQSYRLRDIVGEFPEARESTLIVGAPPREDKESVTLCDRMISNYNIIRHGTTIVSEQVFGVLDKAIDRDFFVVRQYKLH